jgi:hypothetical protein
MSLTNYYDVTREGFICTWGKRIFNSVRETFDTEENARKREANLLEAWRGNTIVMNDCVGLVKREYRDPGEEWKEGAGGIARHRMETRTAFKETTLVVKKGADVFEIAAEVYRLLDTWEERDNWSHALTNDCVSTKSRSAMMKLARDFGFTVVREE